ncbi:MAG: energy-coupling factor ABC transporter permease [Alphaproteobacteria bacterium]|nr:energy-coupling factor ABC transporter permease [Alphaproteobacteria bacterium]
MHIPDGSLSEPVNLTCALGSVVALGYALFKTRGARAASLPMVALVASFIFAAQMLNFPIGGGTSGHFLGGVLAAALLGPWAGMMALALVLAVQGFFFADGGISALGANVLNMGVVGVALSSVAMVKLRAFCPAGKGGFLASVAATSVLSVMAASAVCAVELAFSGASTLGVVFPAMVGTHALIGLGEAAITVAALAAVAVVQPQILPCWSGVGASASSISSKTFGAASLAVAVVLAVAVSPFASAFPDGLEKVAQDKGFEELASQAAQVWTGSPFADYQALFGNEALATSAAGLIGTLLVFALGFALSRVARASVR